MTMISLAKKVSLAKAAPRPALQLDAELKARLRNNDLDALVTALQPA